MFRDFVRSCKQVNYENDDVKADSNVGVKREAQLDEDEDTDTEDAPPSKRRNVVSMSPPQV